MTISEEDLEFLNKPYTGMLSNGSVVFDHSFAAAHLLIDDVCFIAGDGGMVYNPGGGNGMCHLLVNCNDLFGPMADFEEVPWDELQRLFEMHRDHPAGAMKWCCLRRNQRPWSRRETRWRELGWWDDELEALPPRTNG